MHVLIACEFSGIVRTAFRARGHNAWSCDLLPAEDRSEFHIQRDVSDVVLWTRRPDRIPQQSDWDLMIAHPPCTYLASSGARWFAQRQDEQRAAIDFVRALLAAPVHRIALENPIGVLSTRLRKPDQIIQPWWFGHGETKATCLWLKNLPPLRSTKVVAGRQPRVHHEPPSPDRWKNRSRTCIGIAEAMAEQWA